MGTGLLGLAPIFAMKKLNDSMNSPLRFETEAGETLGQFYNSWDKRYHLASYVPYESMPSGYLCGKTGNMSPSRSEGPQRKGPCCTGCVKQLRLRAGLSADAFNELGFN